MRCPALWLLLFLAADAYAEDTSVRVSIFGIFQPVEVRVNSKKPMQVTAVAEDGNIGKYASRSVQIICGGRWPIQMETGKNVVLAGSAQFKPEAGQTLKAGVKGVKDREYAGWIEIKERQGHCLIINHAPLEAYVRDVACRELGTSGVEALKAQAVAVRSYALATASKHNHEGYDFCDLTHCQAYTGRDACTSEQLKHLDAVSGLALVYNDRPAMTYYFSTCAGHTASAADVFGPKEARAYLKGVPDGEKPYCSASEHIHWRFEVDPKDLCARMAEGPCSVEVRSTGKGGWVRQVAVRGKKLVLMHGERFHNLMGEAFGWGKFKSARFQVENSGKLVIFRGRGLGHGAGMCQHGAMGMARAGKSYREILEHYYPGTELKKWP
ncbi:SpoIID/LytB domain-containing protein [Myxococcota bacterium]